MLPQPRRETCPLATPRETRIYFPTCLSRRRGFWRRRPALERVFTGRFSMDKRSSAACLALFIGLSVTLAGCGYMNQVRAMKAFKDGNKAYGASDWRVAVANYEEAAELTASDPACEWCPA